MTRVAVVGGSGFVGRSVVRHLTDRSVEVTVVKAPRISSSDVDALEAWHTHEDVVCQLAEQLACVDVVINCAGDPDASSRDHERLFGANGALPGVIAVAARRAGCRRFVHVSSAAVQGGAACLDAEPVTMALSPYAASKVAGERAVLASSSPRSTVIYRPPSVHSPDRRVTRGIRRLASSPISSVIGAGESPTPQAHIDNVGDAVAYLALTELEPPQVVIHPWEGWTTGELLRLFGGREPKHIPAAAGPAIRWLLRSAARSPRLAPNARRVEMMWFGQRQAQSWLDVAGWTPVADRDAWRSLVRAIDLHHPQASHSPGDTRHD